MEEKKKIRADKIDLKKLDEQLERYLNRVWTKQAAEESRVRVSANNAEWEIDPSKLVVKDIIAHGTFGLVRRGVYDGKDVAVKLLDLGTESLGTEAKAASLWNAFIQEVSVWIKLDHPNVTKFIGAIRGTPELKIKTDEGEMRMPSNVCCIVAEYLPGGTLKSYLIKNRLRQLPFKVVMQLALELARGLSYIHSKKIVHRDIKTDNILLDKNHNVKITEFGVSRVEALNPNEITGQTGIVHYMAPEVLRYEAYNRKCDVYSFGICLWEIYCCDIPYSKLGHFEQASSAVNKNTRPKIPRRCPSSLSEVMKKCWDADPKNRPEMEEVARMLEAIGTSHGQHQGCFCFSRHRGTLMK
ncbi:unnamed protein product [Ilex paraguariensis]|uniref:Protein kinase domain-containing protein n=1 Tax=Ilex paraguariensis TaxID=185542 RepID=A0ABC8R1C3_9AQUA